MKPKKEVPPPLSTEEVENLVKKCVSEKRVEFAPTEEVDSLGQYIDKVTWACAVAMGDKDPDNFSCLVTDYSYITDFRPSDIDRKEFINQVYYALGLPLEENPEVSVVKLAKKLATN